MADLGLGIEIVGLVPQVETGIGGELRALPLDRLHQLPRIVARCAGPAPTTRSWRETPW